jgi:hypothetical protein
MKKALDPIVTDSLISPLIDFRLMPRDLAIIFV